MTLAVGEQRGLPAAGSPPFNQLKMQPARQPANEEQYVKLAELLLSSGKAMEALPWVDKALAAAPASTALLHLRGSCLLAAGNVPGELHEGVGRN